MLRFVLLHHHVNPDHPHFHQRHSHWDLMLEWDGSLYTWELDANPWLQSPVLARRLPPHRLEYLDYEGDLSQNRGCVERVQSGSIQWCDSRSPEAGAYLIDREQHRWLVRWFPHSQSDPSQPTEFSLELISQTNPTIRKMGAIAVVCQEQRLLVIQRSQLVRAPGQFCFPGGTIEPDEPVTVALAREMQEELSLAVQPVRPLWTNITTWGVQLHWWLVDIDATAPIVPNAREVAWYGWLSPAELARKHPLLPSNRLFLEAWQQGEFELPITKKGSDPFFTV